MKIPRSGRAFSTPTAKGKRLSCSLLSCCVLVGTLFSASCCFASTSASSLGREYYVDCSSPIAGDGTNAHPWNSLAAAQAHPFAAGDRIALARGTVCRGSFAPQGSGTQERPIRLTAYGNGPRPRIVASDRDRQALSLFNQQYWQIDSLDISGGNTYGVFLSGNKGTLHHLSLKNLLVHDLCPPEEDGGLKNKDNGLVVIGPSSADVVFDDVLVDGVVAAHTNRWAGILIGGGNYAWKPDAPLNDHVSVRNSTVADVYGDGIILFRDSHGVIETSVAYQTGMQPTESTGTPNAIWTWTCTDCVVRDNEAFLTDSPGVDGGAYDIDWDNTRNVVERNFAHDTQGYCFAAFAAGYVTRESIIRDNLCIANGLSPRLAALQGAVYLHTWNDGTLRGLRIEHNTFQWNPPVASAAAIVDDAGTGGEPIVFTGNRIESAAPLFYRANTQFTPSGNSYSYNGPGDALFTLGDRRNVTLAALNAAGLEKGSKLGRSASPADRNSSLLLDATIPLALDPDGLLSDTSLAQWVVLRSLAAQYTHSLRVTVHLVGDAEANDPAVANLLSDLDPGPIQIQIVIQKKASASSAIRLMTVDGSLIQQWQGFQNAATLGGALRSRLGTPSFSEMPSAMHKEKAQ